jgi:hypothetical protein
MTKHENDLAKRRGEMINRLRKIISKDKFSIMHILGDGQLPGFSFTIGLTNTQHPELVLAGFHPEQAEQILSHVARKVLGGLRIPPNTLSDTLLNDHEITGPTVYVADIPTNTAVETFLMITAVLEVSTFEAIHIVYPDRDDQFPWNRTCAHPYSNQLNIYRTPIPTPTIQ